MSDTSTSRKQLLQELTALRRQVRQLETDRDEWSHVFKQVQAEKNRYQQMVNSSPNPIFSIQRDGTIQTWNPACEQFFKYSSAEILGQSYDRLFEDQVAKAAIEAMAARVFQKDSLSDVEIRYRCKDETVGVMVSRLYPVLDETGKVIACVFANTDISKRKQTESDLGESEARYKSLYSMVRLMCDNVPDLIWAKDLEKRFLFVNRAMCEKLLMARNTDEPVGKTDMFFADRERQRHPDQAGWHTFGEICIDSDAVVLANRKPERFDEFGNVQGQFLFLDVYKAPFWDDQGQMIGTVGCGRVVTREKHIEEERRRAAEALVEEQHMVRTLMDHSPDHIYFKDTAGRFIAANQALADWFNLDDPSQVIGKTDFDFFTPEHAQQALDDEWQVMATGQPIRGRVEQETWLGGCRTWVSTTKVPRRDPAGNIIGTFGISRDISDQVRATEELHQYAQRLQLLHQVDRDILAARSPEEIARLALGHIRRLIPCCCAGVVLFDVEDQRARLLALDADAGLKHTLGEYIPLETALLPRLAGGQLHIIDDIIELPQPSAFLQLLLAENIRSCVTMPLLVQKEQIGSLLLGGSQPGPFNLAHLEAAEEVAVSLAGAIQQARLYEQTRQDAQTRALLLQEVNHRVKNNLASIIGLIHLEQHRPQSDGPTLPYPERLKNLINRIRGLATVHRLLSAAEWAPLPLGELAIQIIDSALQVLPPDKHAVFTISPSSIQIIPRQVNSLALILNELATNTAKYGLSDRPMVSITVDITQEAGRVLIQYRDDGPGYPEEMLHQEQGNVGLPLVRTLVRSDLRGEVRLYNDHGAVAALSFPVSF